MVQGLLTHLGGLLGCLLQYGVCGASLTGRVGKVFGKMPVSDFEESLIG